MGKQSRHERRVRERARRVADGCAEVADRADASLVGLLDGIVAIGATRGVVVRRVEIERFAGLRAHFLDQGCRGPQWCYLPLALVGAGLGESLAIDTNPALVSPAAILAAVAGAWVPGRIAVRFDDDLAAALMATPLESTIPIDAFQRLPAWGLYVDCPLGRASGFFVSLDAGRLEVPGREPMADIDELFIVVVKDRGAGGARHALTTVRLRAGTTLADSIADQERQAAPVGSGSIETPEDQWAEEVGMPRAAALGRILSLVLYLCSSESDTTKRSVPPAGARRRGMAAVTVVSAGFRMGAALRGVAGGGGSSDDLTGRRTAPHLRRAHWHSYWCGSEARGDRRLELRWVPPVPVNADLADELLTVVRGAGLGEN